MGESRGFEIDETTERAGEAVVVELEEGPGVLDRYWTLRCQSLTDSCFLKNYYFSDNL